jgi:TolA-binding protein
MSKKFFLGLFAMALMSSVAVSADETVLEQAEVANVETVKKEEVQNVQDVQSEQQDETAEQGCGCGH